MTPRQVELFGHMLVGIAVAMPFALGLWQAAGDVWRAYRLRQRMRPPF